MDRYWGGLAGLKQSVAQFAAAGVKVGMHTMSANLATNDAYVTPIPDPRLAKTGEFNISRAITSTSITISFDQTTAGLPATTGPMSGACCDMQIGNEIVTYSGVSTVAPYGLTGVVRGAYGTTGAAHAAGTPIYLLTKAEGTGRVFHMKFTLDDAVGSHACLSSVHCLLPLPPYIPSKH
jgi:hypothetical protein